MRIYWSWFEDKFESIEEVADFLRKRGYHGIVFDTRDVGEGCTIFTADRLELDEEVRKRFGDDLIDLTPSVLEDPKVPKWHKKKLWKHEIAEHMKFKCPYVKF